MSVIWMVTSEPFFCKKSKSRIILIKWFMKKCKGLTALHLACQYGHSQIVQLLIEKGALIYKWFEPHFFFFLFIFVVKFCCYLNTKLFFVEFQLWYKIKSVVSFKQSKLTLNLHLDFHKKFQFKLLVWQKPS